MLLKRSSILSIACFFSFFILFGGTVKAQISTTPCNTPLVGPGRTVDNINGGLVSLLSGGTVLNNLLDGDLNNYAQFNTTAIVGSTSIVSLKDTRNFYTAGLRAGFVVEAGGTLLNLSLFNGSFQIKTYRNNLLQETVTSGNISINSMVASGEKQQISFLATQPFDEIELVQTTLLGALTSLRIYYAFVEPASGCNPNCITPITTTNYSSAVATSGTTGVCILCGTTNLSNITNPDTTNSATMHLSLGAGGSTYVNVNIGTDIDSSTIVGFAISSGTGLLSVNLLGGLSISTYLNGSPTPQETVTSSGLLDVTLLNGSGNLQLVKFKTTKDFDEVRLTLDGGLIGALVDLNVYFAFLSFDSDGDGFPDCVDKCLTGDDGLDSNGNGIPDACDTSCSLNLGMDVSLCGTVSSYDFSILNLGSGITWNILPGSPAGATIDSNGLVTGMTDLGTYTIVATQDGICTDTVFIFKRDALINPACNNPISGYGVETFDPSGGSCLFCLLGGSSGGPNNVINGDLNDYIEVTNFASILSNTPVIGVRDTLQTYPAGTRTGFVVRALGNILSATVLSNIQIRTYLNGTLQETVTGNNPLITVESFPYAGNKQRISFGTTQPFNEIALYLNNGITLLTSLRVYYAFTAAPNCFPIGGMGCLEYLLSGNGFHSNIALNHTGLSNAACVTCSINNIGNVIDSNTSNFATISLAAAVGEIASISVSTPQIIGPNHQAGFIISNSAGLLNLSLLGEMRVTTYLNGTQRESFVATNSLVDITLLEGSASGRARISFTTSLSFNEVQFSVTSLAAGLQNFNVYGAFIEKDSDGDGVPDCMDKCCLGPDNLDSDGDGIPDACNIDIAYNATCVACPVTVTLSGNGLASNHTYSLYQGTAEVGVFNNTGYTMTFLPTQSGIIPYSFRIGAPAEQPLPVKTVLLNIHPGVATWSSASTNPTAWRDSANWTSATGNGSHPIWCTDVTIPGTGQHPELSLGDQCRDITFENGASVGKILFLKYRHAFVEFTPSRNAWTLISAPLKYMYSADYHADMSWGSAISPKIYMRYFDVDYAAGKENPDGVAGVSVGKFSRAFANLQEGLNPAFGFALWVNGMPEYPDSNFPAPASFEFPRRNSSGGDVQYSMHDVNGQWTGSPFYMPARGNDISLEPEWTDTSIPDKDNRYRFNLEGSLSIDSTLSVSAPGGETVLLGNPFMSHLDFSRLFNDNPSSIYNYYRIWDGTRFYTYIGSGTPAWTDLDGLNTSNDSGVNQYIAPMQAFFVQTVPAATVDMHFRPLASAVSQGTVLRSNQMPASDLFRINLKVGNETGQAIVAVRPEASNAYNPNEDVFKLFSPLTTISEIYTIADQTAIEINLVDASTQSKTIPIGIRSSQTGTMQLQVTGAENMTVYSEAYLIDHQENKEYNLKTDNQLVFEKTSPKNLEGRFYLSFRNNISTGNSNPLMETGGIQVFVNNGSITVSAANKIQQVGIYDASGRIQYHLTGSGNQVETFTPGLSSGVFILKIETENKIENHKIIIK